MRSVVLVLGLKQKLDLATREQYVDLIERILETFGNYQKDVIFLQPFYSYWKGKYSLQMGRKEAAEQALNQCLDICAQLGQDWDFLYGKARKTLSASVRGV